MRDVDAAVYGNLALDAAGPARGFSCVEGTAFRGTRSFSTCQIDAPAVYPAVSGRRATRGRMAVASIFIAALVAACISASALAAQARASRFAAAASGARETIEVESGDTLWEIAAAHKAAGVGTTSTMDIIRDWNGLADAALTPGMELEVPATAR